MTYDTQQMTELAEQNPHNVLEINLAGENSIGSMGRTNIEVVDSGEDFIEAKLLNFAQVKDVNNPEEEELLTEAKYIDEHEHGKGATLWHEGRTYKLKTSEIATATPSNMLSRAEKKEDEDLMECPYCGKEYHMESYYKKHVQACDGEGL